METPTPNQPIDLQARAYRHLVQTLLALLPPPADDTPEAILARNRAALASMAALAPSNANEAELAAQCIAARAQADDILRLIRLHAGDPALVVGLNAQYTAMVRASLAVHDHLFREQQRRRKRDSTPGNAGQEERTRQAVANIMQEALSEKFPTVSEVELKSHAAGSETSTRHSASGVIDLRLASARPFATGRQDEPAGSDDTGPRRGRVIH